jgi:hypothetical protein
MSRKNKLLRVVAVVSDPLKQLFVNMRYDANGPTAPIASTPSNSTCSKLKGSSSTPPSASLGIKSGINVAGGVLGDETIYQVMKQVFGL